MGTQPGSAVQEKSAHENGTEVPLAQFRQNVKTFISRAGHSVISTVSNDVKKTVSFNCKTKDGADLMFKELESEYPFVTRGGLKTVIVGQYKMPVAKNIEKQTVNSEPEPQTGKSSKVIRRTLNFIQKHILAFLKEEGFVYKKDYLSAKVQKKGGFVSLNCCNSESLKLIKDRMVARNTNFPYFIDSNEGVNTIRISTKKSPVKKQKTPETKKAVRVPGVKVEESEFVPVLKKMIDHFSKPQPVPETPNTEKLLKEALVKGFNKLLTGAGKNAELLIRTRDGSTENTVKVLKSDFMKAFED